MAFTGERTGLTQIQGCLSVANILLGAGLLSMPYAMKLSGSSGFLVIALCCALFNTSGKFISWGLDLLPPGVPRGYPELGYAAFGAAGRHMVTLAAGLELFGGACMEILIFWRSIQQLIPEQLVRPWLPSWMTIEGVSILVGCLIQVPLCCSGTFKSLSYFSAAGVLSTCSVMAMVVALPILDPHKKFVDEDVAHHTIGTGIFGATGIMALSVAGHSTFPSVRAKMSDVSLFPGALNGAYTITCIVACSIGGVGYWYWGDSAQILVTDDFEKNSPYVNLDVMGIRIHHIVQFLVALNVGTTVPLLLLPLVDILQSVMATARKDAIDARATVSMDEPLLPEAQPSDSPTSPNTGVKATVPSGDTKPISISSHPLAIKFMRERDSKGVSVPDTSISAAETMSPRARERSGMFTPRSQGILAALTPHRRDVVLAAFPLSRGQSVSSMTSSVSMAFTEVSDAERNTEHDKAHANEGYWIRSALLASLCVFAALTRRSLDSVEAVVGAVCVVLSSLLLPTVFYIGIRKQRGMVGSSLWLGGGFMFLFGAGLMTLILGQTIMKLVGDILEL